MLTVRTPGMMNETFAKAFNSRKLENTLSLYEPGAMLGVDETGLMFTSHAEIGNELSRLLEAPGTMVSKNNFCIVHGDITLLRVDFVLRDGENIVASERTAELIWQQRGRTSSLWWSVYANGAKSICTALAKLIRCLWKKAQGNPFPGWSFGSKMVMC